MALYVLWTGYQPAEGGCYYVDGDAAVYMNCSQNPAEYNVEFRVDGNGYLTASIDSRDVPVELVFHPKRVYQGPRFLERPLAVLAWFNHMYGQRFFDPKHGVIARPNIHALLTKKTNAEVAPLAPFAWLDGARL